jgi:ABC-2 type transport system permease protein
LLKVDFGAEGLNSFFFPKLVDTWQQLFNYQTDWLRICINNAVLLLYCVGAAATGIFVFHKKDIG